MIATSNRVIEKAYVELKRLSQDEETQMIFEARQKSIRDENSRLKSAEKKGRLEGRQEEKTQIAKQMLYDGLDMNITMKYTDLSVEEIEEIRRGL